MRKNQHGPISTFYMMTLGQRKFLRHGTIKSSSGILIEFCNK